jgi:hypothetical protein
MFFIATLSISLKARIMTDNEIIQRLYNLQDEILSKLDKNENDKKNAKALDCAIAIIKQTTIQL